MLEALSFIVMPNQLNLLMGIFAALTGTLPWFVAYYVLIMLYRVYMITHVVWETRERRSHSPHWRWIVPTLLIVLIVLLLAATS